MATVVIENLVKTYPDKKGGDVMAVKRINLTIEDREFIVLVGPSGCGKSTTLRMIAGLEEISGGTVAIDGRVVNEVPPKDRDIAMVFQNYALYPHMTVYANLAFGLKLRGTPKAEIDQRVREAAAMLGLDEYLQRLPKALSGGQRQRVAVGRAIVRRPKVFLFDEPLSNLDAKMRVAMRTEIAKLHARLDATMIYVTHDQVEAMTMGDRICVMKDGVIQQVADPLTLYNQPANLFVAGFIGSPAMNFFRGRIEASDGHHFFVEENPTGTPIRLALPEALVAKAEARLGNPTVLGVRPEHIRDVGPTAVFNSDQIAEVAIEVIEPMGAETFLYLNSGATTFIARVPPRENFKASEKLRVVFNLDQAHLFDPVTEATL